MLPTSSMSAPTVVLVPAGTRVGLQFSAPFDTAVATPGAKVMFTAVAAVAVGNYIVLKQGAEAAGTVTRVQEPKGVAVRAETVVGLLAVTAADGTPLNLADVLFTTEGALRRREKPVAMIVAGGKPAGPTEHLAGALVNDGNVVIPVGTVVIDVITAPRTVTVP